MPKFAPWSYSKLKAFETCPRQFYHMKIAKTYTEPEREHLIYGNEFHKACELYVRDGKSLPKKFDYAKGMLDTLMKKPGEKHTELRMGLNKDLEPCEYFAKDIWYRGIVDLLIIDEDKAWIVDYKTSKNEKYADTGQLELMYLTVLKHYPNIKKIHAALLFVIPKKLITETYTREDEPALWKRWLARYTKAETAAKNNIWNPNPSGLCNRHCAVLECPHNGQG
jgi:CRISPR/Cas system-associated exonuclease Cas4 (RecB family)